MDENNTIDDKIRATMKPIMICPLCGEDSIIGTSLDYAHNYKRVLPVIHASTFGFRTFVNIEPLMSRMDVVDFSGIDFVIIGALTGRKYRPDPAWHKSIKHPVIYYKKNYQIYFPELKND